MADDLQFCLLATQRPNIGAVSRSMAVAKRLGPDFYFLADKNSTKFEDLKNSKEVQITFQDSKTQNWISVSGEASVTENDDPRIEKYWSKGTSVWFGNLGDGQHDGGPKDPRITLIEVKSRYIAYWKKTVSSAGFAKEIGVAAATGRIADTGVTRELTKDDIATARDQANTN
jgi:general stress protein 26